MARDLQMNDASTPGDSATLTNAVGLVLRRIVRLMVGTVSFPALIEIMKSLYVEEAEKKINDIETQLKEYDEQSEDQDMVDDPIDENTQETLVDEEKPEEVIEEGLAC